MKLQRAKGVRDFLPREKIAREKIVQTLKKIFEIYGYNPLETPIIERFDLFASKYGVGEGSDTLAESFQLQDRGDRELILRSEFTVPFARIVGMNRQLKMPFKRYQIGRVFRDGPLKIGRYREFWQCDVDVVGCEAGLIDVEILNLAQTVFGELGLEVDIRFNSRKLLNNILDQAGVIDKQKNEVIVSIDKYDKVGSSGVRQELEQKGIESRVITDVLELIKDEGGSNRNKVVALKNKLKNTEGIEEVEKTLSLLSDQRDIIFMPNLARGLGYYTGNVFEVFLKDTSRLGSSLAGGGRYDKMIGGFLEEDKNYPAIGVSFGLETIFDALGLESKNEKMVADYYVVSVSDKFLKQSFALLGDLRRWGWRADMDYLGRPFSKALDYANWLGVKKVLILGEDEIRDKAVTVKDMKSGKQELVKLEDLKKNLG